MTKMTCDNHDRLAASSQFITHTVGLMLEKLSNFLEAPFQVGEYVNI